MIEYCNTINLKVKELYVNNFNYIIDEYLNNFRNNDINLLTQEKPAVIAFMGHVDHGKTTLIDTIRQTNVQQKEAGGITQKITVLQILFQNKKLFLLDSPGHVDFVKLRHKGVYLTDLIVLVIDSKDGIMEQTIEIIQYLHKYAIPCLVFVNNKKNNLSENKINLDRILNQLQEKNIIPIE